MAQFRIDYSNPHPSNAVTPKKQWPRIVLTIILIGALSTSIVLMMGTARYGEEIEYLRHERNVLLLRCDSLHAAKIQAEKKMQKLEAEMRSLRQD